MAIFLAYKEVIRNKGRYLLIAGIVALITVLVLFIAGLSEGLAAANREYIQKLNGELLVFQEGTELSTTASRIGRSEINAIRRVEGMADLGQVGFASAKLVEADGKAEIDVSLIGIEPGRPGAPPAREGTDITRNRSNDVIVDTGVVDQAGLTVGDTLTIKVTQGTSDQMFDLNIVGITDRRQYFFQPAVFVPILTWDKIRPQAEESIGRGELVSNIVVVKVTDPAETDVIAQRIEDEVQKVEVVNRKTAWEAIPGYAAQQSTLSTQSFFTFFIGILVVGGFFQIQTLQKVAQIGMLKAIGAGNWTVGGAAVLQIVTVNAIGVAIGTAGSLALGATFPSNVPILFTGEAVLTAILALLTIGPAGGLVSVFALLRVEPLRALGLAQ